MIATVAILVCLGVLLMILETFVPGMVAGILGGVCVLSGVVIILMADDFDSWSSWTRSVTALGIIVGAVVMQFLWLRYFAVHFWKRTFTLQEAIQTPAPGHALPLGTEGVALTDLRPLGRAEFGGARREVRCEDGTAPAGSRLRITGTEPGNLVVRVISPSAPVSTSHAND